MCRLANVLLARGVKKGDRVAIYMPMIPEAAYAMLACARIGAVHSVVFGGFSAEALRDRIVDARCKVVITANEGMRGGRRVPLKAIVDRAVEGMSMVETVLVARRTDADVPMQSGRDLWLDEECKKQRSTCTVAWMGAEDPLFILYTSGSTGQPKGLLHTTGGYLVYAAHTFKHVFDYHPGDVYCCAADVGWITGHSYIVYGPLANGATTVMFESMPTYPDSGRYWQMVDDLGINIFYTAPTALRAIAQAGNEPVKKSQAHQPAHPRVGGRAHQPGDLALVPRRGGRGPLRGGGHLVADRDRRHPDHPAAGRRRPPSPARPRCRTSASSRCWSTPTTGEELKGNGVAGALCLTAPWPGQARTVWGDHQRFKETYFTQYKGKYFTGDGCRRDEDGYYWITGRIDDVHQRVGPPPGHRRGRERAGGARGRGRGGGGGLPARHQGPGHLRLRGALAPSTPAQATEQLEGALKEKVRQVIGPFAAPDVIHITAGLPKTRSGKIMRRILRKIAAAEYTGLGDISTLADPEVVARLIEEHQKSLPRK